jgi:hypothetical protein
MILNQKCPICNYQALDTGWHVKLELKIQCLSCGTLFDYDDERILPEL